MTASTPATWGGDRAVARERRRARANARVSHGVSGGHVRDPLAHPRPGWVGRAGTILAILVAALVAHAAVLASFYGVSAFFAKGKKEDPRNRPIELTVIEPPPPEPEPVPAPEPEPEPEPEPKPAKPKPKPRPRKPRPPPPDPVDTPAEPPPPPQKKVRRIVGLSMKSTVEGGGGPSFAVGNTRMGRTADRAEDPNEAEDLPKGAPRADRSNRAASRLPIGLGGAKVEKPKYAGPRLEPPYPDDYRAQNLEARITVEVQIGPDGRVSKARVVKGSPHTKFEEAALAIARRQRWIPAKRGGKPIAWTLTYTYQFTLRD